MHPSPSPQPLLASVKAGSPCNPVGPSRLSVLGHLVSGVLCTLSALAQVPNALPLHLGADQTGHNSFQGHIAAVRLYDRPLEAQDIATLARAHPNAPARLAGLRAQWLFGGATDGVLTNDPVLPARRVGAVTSAEADGIASARFEGGYFVVADHPRLAFEGGTVEAWVRPAPSTRGRIVDKITPGGSDGWLLDTHPGQSLRLIAGAETLLHALPPSDAWTHVVALIDPAGTARLYVNGTRVTPSDAWDEGIALTGSAPPPGGPLTLWYRQPARRWTEAVVLGNGRLGGMLWGGVRQERLDLNEDTLWSGEPYDNLNPKGLKSLPTIRALLLAGQNAEAQRLVEQDMNGKYNQCYLPLGALTLEFPFQGDIEDYRRALDLETGLARVQFTHHGTRYTRETLASFPDQVIAMRFTRDGPARISFRASLSSQLRHTVRPAHFRPGRPTAAAVSPAPSPPASPPFNLLRLLGRAPIHADPHYLGRRIEYDDAPDGRGMRFEARLTATHTGGSLQFTEHGLVADQCDEVTLLLVAATSYHGPQRSPSRDGRDPSALCDATLTRAIGKAYDALRAAHVADHRGLFERVRIDLGSREAAGLPTDVRVKRYQPGADPSLAALYFQFGRYLLIAGSRPGTQPLNLQGIWNKDLNPAWSANWTLNCNAQINYWPAEVANLPECHLPLLDLTTELSIDGTNMAKNLYGAGGWVAHHNTDIWRQAGPVGGSACWSVFPAGSAWLCQHLWEHYAFSGDPNTLRRLWPVLAGAARYYLDALIPEPNHGWLVTAPDVNFENAFRKPDGASACSCYGPTASLQMIRELFRNCLAARDVLPLDPQLQADIAAALPRLAPMQISPTTGELQEWVQDWQRTAPCQVLSSWGAVCSAQITPRSTPELAAGLRKIFDTAQWWKQGAVGSWQGAFQANTYARLHDGNLALDVLDMHLRRVVNPNLTANFSGMAEWEIDGNLGLTAAIAEMLLQSHAGELDLLPALPNAWTHGSVTGLRARAGVTVDLAWADGRLTRATLRSARGGRFPLRYQHLTDTVTLAPGAEHSWPPSL